MPDEHDPYDIVLDDRRSLFEVRRVHMVWQVLPTVLTFTLFVELTLAWGQLWAPGGTGTLPPPNPRLARQLAVWIPTGLGRWGPPAWTGVR